MLWFGVLWFRANPGSVRKKMFYVYVLYDGKEFYIGLTADIKRRLSEHKAGKVRSTKKRIGLKLIFYEAFLNKSDAERRERYFKTTKGKRSLRLMLKRTLEE